MPRKSDLLVIGCDPVGFEIAFAAAGLGASVRMAPQDLPPSPGQRARLGAVGVGFIDQPVRFRDQHSLVAGEEPVLSRFIVIANGAERPRIPIEHGRGDRTVVIGQGGMAVARAMAAAGSRHLVTLVCPGGLLPDFEPEMVDQLRLALLAEKIDILTPETMPTHDHATGRLDLGDGQHLGESEIAKVISTLPGEPRLASLDIEKAGLSRIAIDDGLRIPGRRIFLVGEAIADMPGVPPARNQLGIVIGAALYGRKAGQDSRFFLHSVPTRPGLAEFGLLPSRFPAGKRSRFRILRAHRPASASRQAASVLAVIDGKARILGAAAFGDRAPELATTLLVLARQGTPITELASLCLSSHGEDDLLAQLARQPLVEKLRSPAARRLMQLRRIFG